MKISKSKIEVDTSTEQKIKDVARKLFTQKGFAATKTREIAEEAGINLALLNYYFRSKQKLYDLIMEENMQTFRKGIDEIFVDTQLSFYDKVEQITNLYIDEFLKNKDLPMFIVHTVYSDTKPAKKGNATSKKIFIDQIQKKLTANKKNHIHPSHLMSNLIGLIIFPFLIRPLVQNRAKLSDSEFLKLMEERKKWIPIWIKNMIESK